MLLDLEKIDAAGEAGVERQVEICIVGAGAAGITAARALLDRGHDVLLLESGGADYEASTAALNSGESVGTSYYDLMHARLRFFGGTTAIWGGRCSELDPIDLVARNWVSGSGWPIGAEDLAIYYRRARPLFGIAEASDERTDVLGRQLGMPDFDPAVLRTAYWDFDPQSGRFTLGRCRDLIDHPRCTILTHANVTAIEATAQGRSVDHLLVRSLGGRTLRVRARTFVLAAGGIENPRLLLASTSAVPAGLGNGHDQVGRYFMEHPHARGGRIVDADAWRLLRLFGRRHRIDGHEIAALLRPGEKLQAALGILNSSLTIVGRQPADVGQFWGMKLYNGVKHGVAPTRGGRNLWRATKYIAANAQRTIDPARPWLLHKLGRLEISLLVRAEQAPNPDSRIILGRDQDALGMPRPTLDWRLSDIDKRSVGALVGAVGREMKRLGLGRVESAPWLADPGQAWAFDPLVSAHPIGGYHHMGTTRMSTSPRTGVVDAAGRVHGSENLYVVGSSVFPTSGWANPTLTIAALALRTADHIADELAGRRVVRMPIASRAERAA